MPSYVTPGSVVGTANLSSTALGMEYLGGVSLSAPAQSLTLANFPARDGLMISFQSTGLTAVAEYLLQFGTAGSIDAGTKYWYKPFRSAQVVGIALFGGEAAAGATYISLNQAVTNVDAAHFLITMGNRATTSKSCQWGGTVGSGAVGTIPTTCMGAAEYVEVAAQVNTVGVFVFNESMNAGATLQVMGRNYP